MFSILKAKIASAVALVVTVMVVYIKILQKRNKDKAEKIKLMKQNAEVESKKHVDDVKREKFNAVQKERIDKVNNTDDIDSIDNERGVVNESDDFTTVNR